MDLSGVLLRASIPSTFVVVEPSFTAVRLAVERELRRRGWAEAVTPANADMVIVCGQEGGALAEPVNRLWGQTPSPRTLVRISTPDAVARHFDEARAALRDSSALRKDAAERGEAEVGDTGMSATVTNGSDHDSADTVGHDMDMGGMDMSMEMPGGKPMADRSPDRDGLTLDQLHVVLGPALPDWPSGLRAHLVIQGDIVQAADVDTVGARQGSSFWLDLDESAEDPSRVRAAAAADSLHRFLAVAGWGSAAVTGRRLRDELLVSDPDGAMNLRFMRWLRRVRRSRMLRWSTNGLGHLSSDAPERLRGDVAARYLLWTDEIATVLDPHDVDTWGTAISWRQQRIDRARAALSLLPALLLGQELSAARLIIASFDPDLETLHVRARSSHMTDDSHD